MFSFMSDAMIKCFVKKRILLWLVTFHYFVLEAIKFQNSLKKNTSGTSTTGLSIKYLWIIIVNYKIPVNASIYENFSF